MAIQVQTIETMLEWSEFGHKFRIDRIEPRQVGASIRHFRLYDSGEPAYGHQWHSSFDAAKEWANYLLQSSYGDRIRWLEQRVSTLENQLADLRKEKNGNE